MSKRKLYMIGDFLAKQEIHVMHARQFGDSSSGYDEVFQCFAEFDYHSDDSDKELLEQLFEEFNVGTSEVAQAYRAKRLRSLSVGDVIVLDQEVAWLCDKYRWEPFDLVGSDGQNLA
jgi:hypothetical protein